MAIVPCLLLILRRSLATRTRPAPSWQLRRTDERLHGTARPAQVTDVHQQIALILSYSFQSNLDACFLSWAFRDFG